MRVRVAHVLAVGIAACLAHRQVDREAVRRSTHAKPNADAAAARFIGAVLARRVFSRHQVDLVIRQQGDVLAAADVAADGAQVAVLAVAAGDDCHVAAGLDARTDRRGAGSNGVAFALGITKADTDANACVLNCLDRRRCILERGGRVQCRQRLHARVARVRRRLCHIGDRLERVDQRHADGAADRRLAVAGMIGAVAGVVGAVDQDVLGADRDIPGLRQRLARRLGVLVACIELHVPAKAGDLAADLGDGVARAVLRRLHRADRRLEEAADHARLLAARRRRFGGAVFGADDRQVAPGSDGDILVRHQRAALDQRIASAGRGHVAAAEHAAHLGYRIAVVGLLGLSLAVAKAARAERKAALLFFQRMAFAVGRLGGRDDQVAACVQAQGRLRRQLTGADLDVVSGRDGHVLATDAAADGQRAGAVVGPGRAALLEGAARFAMACRVRQVVFGCADDVDVVGGRQQGLAAGGQCAARDVQVGAAAEAGLDRQVAGRRHAGADHRFVLEHLLVVRFARRIGLQRRIGLVRHRRDIYRTARRDEAAAFAVGPDRHLRPGQVQVAAGLHGQVAADVDLAQLVRHAAVVLPGVADLRLVGAAGLDRVEADLVAGRDHGAAGGELARQIGQVAPGLDRQRAGGGDRSLVRQLGMAAAALRRRPALGDRQRFVPDIASGIELDAGAGDAAAAVDDVLSRHQQRAAVAAVDQATGVGDALGDVDRHAVAGDQRAAGAQCFLAQRGGIHLRHQHGLNAPVRQLHGFADLHTISLVNKYTLWTSSQKRNYFFDNRTF